METVLYSETLLHVYHSVSFRETEDHLMKVISIDYCC